MDAVKIVAVEKGKVELQHFDVCDPKPGEVQVKVSVSLISPGTERAWINRLPGVPVEFPFDPGYQTAGTVTKVGKGVSGYKEGDRVATVMPHRSLGNIVAQADSVMKIPDGVKFEHAVFMRLSHVGMTGARRAMIELGNKVLVLGQGIVGIFAAQYAAMCGGDVIGADIIDWRLNVAKKCGIAKTINSGNQEFVRNMSSKPKIVIESTGIPAIALLALEAVGKMGKVVMLGSTRGTAEIDIYRDIHVKGTQVIGAHTYHAIPRNESCFGNWTEEDNNKLFFRLLKDKKVIIDPMITRVAEYTKTIDVYKGFLSGDDSNLGIMFKW